ncbi:MAG: hypothetical protein JRN52_13625 [Nitrososphaerota archaeon]|nr:hypothetical protein [Nitrososphaerota archaeon]
MASKHNGLDRAEDYPDLFRQIETLSLERTILDGEFVKKERILYVFKSTS